MYNNAHIFEVDSNKYVIDHHRMFFCQLDKDADDALAYTLNGEKTGAELTNNPTLKLLIGSGFFLSAFKEYEVPNFNYDRMNFSFAPIHECNFTCKYCFAKDGEDSTCNGTKFDKKKIDELLNYIYKKKYTHISNYKFDFVSGGEPLLNASVLEYFLGRVRHLDEELDKSTTVMVVTNGTLLSPEIISMLDNHNVYLGISLDGPKQVHNRNRVYKDGSGTYDDVINGIKMLEASGASPRLKDAWAMTVVTKNTGSLVNVMEHGLNLGFRRMQMQLVRLPSTHPVSFNSSDLVKLKADYKELYSHMLDRAEDGDLSLIKMIANDNDSFGKFIGRLLLRDISFYRCFAGKNKISFSALGDIYPCDSFCGSKDFLMGSIDESEVETGVYEMFKDAHVLNCNKCKECWARFICGGDCYYNSFNNNGNIYEPDYITCHMNRFFIEHAIDLLIKLKIIDPKLVQQLTKFLRVG